MFIKSRHELNSLRNSDREWQSKFVSLLECDVSENRCQRGGEKKIRNHSTRVQVSPEKKASTFLLYLLPVSVT